MKIIGTNVLITGGASGIGKIMSRICLEKGAKNVIIWDVNQTNLDSTAADLGAVKPLVKGVLQGHLHTYAVNVTDNNAITSTYQKVKEDVGDVDILINCAGVVRGNNTFDKQTVQDINLTMDVNATAPMLVALQIMPDMLRRNCGHICNIASAAGMLGMPKLSIYCASKWAVIGWTESMRVELKQAHSKVKVTTVAPYFINTGMFDGVNSKIFPILKPEKTAAKIIKGIEKGKSFNGIPFSYHFIRTCQALLPNVLFDYFFGEIFGIYSVMDHFTGRKARPEQKITDKPQEDKQLWKKHQLSA